MGIAVAFILIAAILSSAGLIRIATSSVADRKAFRKIRLVAPTVCLICLCFDRKRSPTGTLGYGCQLISLYRWSRSRSWSQHELSAITFLPLSGVFVSLKHAHDVVHLEGNGVRNLCFQIAFQILRDLLKIRSSVRFSRITSLCGLAQWFHFDRIRYGDGEKKADTFHLNFWIINLMKILTQKVVDSINLLRRVRINLIWNKIKQKNIIYK